MVTRSAAALALVLFVIPASASAIPPSTPVTVAGGGSASTSTLPAIPPFPLATGFSLQGPTGIGLVQNAAQSERFVAESNANRILILGGDGTLRAAAGNGTNACPQLNHSAATSVSLSHPAAATSLDGMSFLIADTGCGRIEEAGIAGYSGVDIHTSAGDAVNGHPACGGTDITNADPTTGFLGGPVDVEPTSPNSYLVADFGCSNVRAVTPGPSGSLVTVAGDGADPPADDGSSDAKGVWIGQPADLSVVNGGSDYYIASNYPLGVNLMPDDPPDGRVYRVQSGKIVRVAGGGATPVDSATTGKDAQMTKVTSVLALPDGGFLLYDGGSGAIRRVASDNSMSTVVGGLQSSGRLSVSTLGLYSTQTNNFNTVNTVVLVPALEIAKGGPTGTVASRDASFTFASWDASATFQCSIDSGNFSVCPGTFSSLADGKHMLQVKATTDGNLVSPPADTSWFVDATPPLAFDLTAPDDGSTGSSAKPGFSWKITADDTSHEGSAGLSHYELWIDSAKAADVDPSSCTDTCSVTAPAALGDGQHSWEVHAIDGVGNTRTVGPRKFTVQAPPVAALAIAPARSLINRAVTFDGSASSDPNGSIARYEWDLDGDGTYETDTGTTPTTSRSYDKPATITASLRVTDNSGLTSVASGTLTVTATAPAGRPLGISINDGAQYTNDPDVTLFASWPSFATTSLVSNDGGFVQAQPFPVAETIPWKLDSSGPERLPKTVYVRYVGGIATSETYTDDIILDQTPPKVLAATVTGGPAAAGAVAAKAPILKIRAKDNVSGVGFMQVTSSKRKPGRVRKFKSKVAVSKKGHVFVRVRDRAGNWSRWRRAR